MLLPLLFPYDISAHLSIYYCKEIIKDTDLKNIDLSLFKNIVQNSPLLELFDSLYLS